MTCTQHGAPVVGSNLNDLAALESIGPILRLKWSPVLGDGEPPAASVERGGLIVGLGCRVVMCGHFGLAGERRNTVRKRLSSSPNSLESGGSPSVYTNSDIVLNTADE